MKTILRVGGSVAVLLLAGFSPVVQGASCQVRAAFDFEDGRLPGYDAWSAYKVTYPATIISDTGGNKFFRLRATEADRTGTGTTGKERVRSETTAGGSSWCSNLESDRYVTYNFSVRHPADAGLRARETIIWQLFQYAAPDAIKKGACPLEYGNTCDGMGPAVWLYWKEDKGFVIESWYWPAEWSAPLQTDKAIIGRAGIGAWANFSIRIYWTDVSAKSSVIVSLNGKQVANLAGKVPSVHSPYSNCGASAHFGLYGDVSVATGILDYDNIQIKVGDGCTGSRPSPPESAPAPPSGLVVR